MRIYYNLEFLSWKLLQVSIGIILFIRFIMLDLLEKYLEFGEISIIFQLQFEHEN